MIAVLDTGPLLAALDRGDRRHPECRDILRSSELELVIPAMVVTEVSYFLNRRFGPKADADFLRGLIDFEVESPQNDDWPAIADLVERYADFPLGGVDASVAVLAERLGTELIVTLDRRHFGALRMKDGRPFRILPE